MEYLGDTQWKNHKTFLERNLSTRFYIVIGKIGKSSVTVPNGEPYKDLSPSILTNSWI